MNNVTIDIKDLVRSLIKKGIKLSVSQDKLLIEGNLQSLDEDVKSFIKSNKKAIVEYIESWKKTRASTIRKRPQDSAQVLSFAQQRLWFIDQLEGGGGIQYNMPVALRLNGVLNHGALQRALDTIVARHEILRSCYYTQESGEPGVRVQPTQSLLLTTLDLRNLARAECEKQVFDLALADATHPFNLAEDLMLRATLLVLDEHEHVLLFCMHHIASDGWSIGVLTGEFVALYEAFSRGEADPLPPLLVQYADFSHWQRSWLQGAVLEQHLEYWLPQLSDLPQVHSLPLDFSRPAIQSFIGAKYSHCLDKNLSDSLQTLSVANGATLFMTLQTAFAVLLARYSNETDIVMGTPIANRTQAELSPLIGFFVNNLVLRSDLSGNPSFTTQLKKNKEMALQAYEYQHIPFEMLVDKLRPERSASHGALYQILFVLQNNEQEELRLPELTVSSLTTEHVVAKYDLQLSVEESASGLQLSWTYCSALFSPASIARIAQHWESLLRGIVAAPDCPILKLPLLTASERYQIIEQWNGKITEFPRELCLPQAFEVQVELSPHAPAFRCGDIVLTYSELNCKANRLAYWLMQAGVVTGAVVGVHCQRSPELLVALLAIVKCGAAYVPFDPNSSTARLSTMIADAGIKLVLTQSRLASALATIGIEILTLDSLLVGEELADYAGSNPALQGVWPRAEQSAYIIYTSGSTGVPKGVAISHANLIDYCSYALRRYYADDLSGSLVVTSHAFDITVPSLFLPLLAGGCVEFMPSDAELEALAERLAAVGDGYLLRMTPLHVQALLALLPEDIRPSAAHVFVIGGASFPLEVARELQGRFPHSQIFNHYGPTEATVGCCLFDVSAELERLDKVIPIGKPMDNTALYVLNEALEPAPIGVCGELHIGGEGLSNGYLNRPELSAEKFIQNPFVGDPYPRLYKSGDIVRWLVDGTLEYLGRCDDQVKIRGFRVELQEIEHLLRNDFRVAQAVVTAREGVDGEKRLVAYVVPAEGADDALVVELTRVLRHQLPEYMVPATMMILEALPLSANGKIDKRRLPEPVISHAPTENPPETETECRLAGLWSDLLKRPCDDVMASFFELGGHSLLATRLISAINRTFAVNLKIVDVFTQPTVRALAALIDASGSSDVLNIPRISRDGALPLSFAQQRLWLIDRLEGGSQYNMPFALHLRGGLDCEVLQRVLDSIVRRHEVLRSVYQVQDNGEVCMRVQPVQSLPLARINLVELEPDVREQQLRTLALADAARRFDLKQDLMFRASLVVLGEQEHVLLFNMHHIASDGWSIGVLIREFGALYSAFSAGQADPLPALAIQYGDFADWQRAWLQGEVLERQLNYWLQQLTGLPPTHSLPLDFPRPAEQRFAGANHVQRLDTSLSERLQALSQAHGATLFMTLQTAFAVLLSRYSHETDIVMGTPIANRTQPELAPLVGFFVNTLVLRSDLSGNPSFSRLLQQNRQMALQAYEHQHIPFEMLVDKLHVERSFSHSPLFQIMFALQNHERDTLSLPGLELRVLEEQQHTAKFDLTLGMRESEHGLLANWEYSTDLFRADTIVGMAEVFAELLAAIVAAPDCPVQALPLLSEARRQQLLLEFNASALDYPRQGLIHELFEAQAAQRPEAVAVVYEDEQLSYGELNARANQIAHYLLAQGVQADDRIAICVERGVELVVGLLGILKSGAGYVPLDPSYPQERLSYMLADSAPKMLLSQRGVAEHLAVDGLPCLLLDPAQMLWAAQSEQNPARRVRGLTPQHLAYISYTSGSTGEPKGVMIEHHSVVRLVTSGDYVALGPETVLAQASTIAFDAATFEIWGALLNGGRLVIVDKEELLDATRLQARLDHDGIDTLFVTTALFNRHAQDKPGCFAGLDHLLFGGEAVSPAAVAAVAEHGMPGRLLHMYGPTENTTFSTWYAVQPASVSEGGAIPIGRGVADTRLYVLDAHLNPVPVGVPGELYVAGAGLARGYLNRPALTAERFVADPFVSTADARMYRTGDVVRWQPTGVLEFLGRNDFQVKIRGFRIELGEIETQLLACAGVRAAVVLAREDVPGVKRLVAYLTAAEASMVSPMDLREQLAAKMPDYMVPSAFVVLPALPLTPNGKLDRKALPMPDGEALASREYAAPQGEFETALALLWQELLGVERVDRRDNFFALGGTSLSAVRLEFAIQQRFGVEASMRELFEQAELAAQAALLAVKDSCQLQSIEVLARDGLPLPLSFAQQRLWFIEQLAPGGSQYNIPLALHLKGPLDLAALQGALQGIVIRHEVLRTVYAASESGEPVQIIQASSPLPLTTVDLRADTAEGQARQVRQFVMREANEPFDLRKDLMLRVAVLLLGEAEYVLLLTMHHIASDGWSRNVLIEEFVTLYQALSRGQLPALPALEVQYADFAYWQRSWLQGEVLELQLSYWLQQLADLPRVHGLPLDSPRPAVQRFEGALHLQQLDKTLSEQLQALSAAEGATLFMTLQTAFAVLLARYSDETDIVMGTPIANRTQASLAPLIGFFVNTLVLRSDLSGNPSFRTLLQQNKQMALQAYEHQHIPFEMLVDKLQPERCFSHSPLFQIMFALQNSKEQTVLNLPELSMQILTPEQHTAKFELTLALQETEKGLQACWEYCTELFRPEMIASMAEAFTALLAGIVAAPECPIQRLPMLSTEAMVQQLQLGHGRSIRLPAQPCIHDVFEAQVLRTPQAIAVIQGDEAVSYAELNRRANRLAHYLLVQADVAERPIGLCVERSIDWAVAALGILKAGGVYVPLDPSYPTARLAHMLDDAGVDILLTQRALVARLPDSCSALLLLDDERALATCSDNNPKRVAAQAHHLAAMLYTSGSTGKPKGVMLEHRSIISLVNDPDYIRFDAETVFLQLSSLAFDAATLEFWGCLLNGGCLVSYAEEKMDLAVVAKQINAHGVTTMLLTAALFDLWSHQQVPCPSLRFVLTGGDVVNPEAVARVYRNHPALTVVHAYGPTENTTLSVCMAVPRDFLADQRLPLGSPIQGTQVYVLSADGALQAPGAVGELHIAGQGLARGYWRQPELTAEKFITNPFVTDADARMYSSGDRARWSMDGRLEFMGRIDNQVKLRGFRIEPDELEVVLSSHPLIQQAMVLIMGEPKRLVAYVVPQTECAQTDQALAQELRDYLGQRLPVFMLPSDVVVLAAMPLTVNGKLDRTALPLPDASSNQITAYSAPRHDTDAQLCELWQSLLGCDSIGIDDNFFAVGGNSLCAVRLGFGIQERFGVELPIRTIFERPTIRELAQAVMQAQRSGLHAIEAVGRDERPLPLSFAQQRLWFIDQLAPGGTQYNMPVALKLQGELNESALQQAFDEIRCRHEVLRTVYVTSTTGEAHQQIRPATPLVMTRFDRRGLSLVQQEAEVLRLAQADAATPYRLDRDPMLRVSLILLAADSHVLLLNMHHIASDGWSMGVLVKEFTQLYEASILGRAKPLPPLAIQYADYAVWQRAQMQGEYLDTQLAYWQRQLAGLPPVHSLRLDRPRPLQPSFVGKIHAMDLSLALIERLQHLAQTNGASLFMVLHAAFAVLLGRWSREDDVVIGSPIAGRTRHELEPLIGFFVNTLLLRSHLNGQATFTEFLRTSRDNVLDAYEHQDVPFEMLVEKFCPERNLNHSPLFQILFSVQNQGLPDVALPGLTVSAVGGELTMAKFDLSVQIAPGSDSYRVEWNYSVDIFDANTIANLAEHYVLLLEAIVREPDRRLAQLPLQTETDRQFYALQRARTVNLPAPVLCLHERFEQQAQRWPDHTALICEDVQLSYRELNERANRLARYLQAEGVQAGALIGLFVERSLDMVIGLLGILKAGAGYVPMDPHNPSARTQHMVDDAGLSWIVSQQPLQARLPNTCARVLYTDAPEIGAAIARQAPDNLPTATVGVSSQDPAYVIYTSGSTGKPKGVVVEHRHVMRLFDSSAAHFSFDHRDCWTLFHSYAFDFSVWEIWGALLFGGRLVIVPYAISRSTPDFYQLLKEQGVTVLNQTPSAFYLLTEQVRQAADLSQLRYVVFGGEALDPLRLRPWLAHFGDGQPELINMYGITETTVHVTYRRIREADTASPSSVIGVPLNDLSGYVCNEAMALQPLGVPGELYVGGGGVSRGYLNRPELNRERFIDNPFEPSSGRLYRTGDLVRWTELGELEYLGRIDHQAKLRGFRIELGEIEHELLNSGLVKEGVVLIHGESGHDQQLVAYVVQEPADAALPNRLRKHLLSLLPTYMVPSAFIVLERIPLTDNGKVDRRALLSMTGKCVAQGEYTAPSTRLEAHLCEIWSSVLAVETVGIHDNFFAIGGDSIRVVQIVKLAESQGIRLEVKDVFLHQTVAELADFHQQHVLGRAAPAQPAPLALLTQLFDPAPYLNDAVEDCYPVTAMQQRMLEQHGDNGLETAVYQPRVLYDIRGIELEAQRLESALVHMIRRHPVLRTRFVRSTSGDYVQLVRKEVDFRLPVLDVSHLDAEGQQQMVEALVASDGPFLLGEAAIRFTLLIYAPAHYGLFISSHHAGIDGWALVEMRNELLALYQRLSEGLSLPPLSAVNVFKEHVALEWEARESAEHAAAWRELMADHVPMPALVELAVPHTMPAAALALQVDVALVAELQRLARQRQVTLKALLLLAYQRALARLLGTSCVTIDVVTSGRSPRLSDPLGAIGLFWSLLPVCARLEGNDDGAIEQTARQLLSMDAHALYPADRIWALSGAPGATYAAFNYVNFHNAKPAAKAEPGPVGALTVRYASDRFAYAVKLAISGDDSDGGIDGSIEFDRRYFSDEQMRVLRDDCIGELRRLVTPGRSGGNHPIQGDKEVVHV